MHASVGDREVGLQVLGTGALVVQRDDGDVAVTSAGAEAVEVRLDVRAAADVSIVLRHAASERHAAVLGRVDENHLLVTAGRVERLPFAVLGGVCETKAQR